VMDEVSKIGKGYYQNGRGMDTVTTSFGHILDQVATQLEIQDPLAPFFYRHLIECWYGTSVYNLQLSEFIDEDESNNDDDSDGEDCSDCPDKEYSPEGDFYGPHCTVRRGMERVLQPLLGRGVRESILLQQEVTKITNETDNIVLETSSGRRFRARTCVVTLSVGCLVEQTTKNALFSPSLSGDKVKALTSLQMGYYKKVLLTFDSIFWPTHDPLIGLARTTRSEENTKSSCEQGLGNYLLLDNLWARDGIPCLEALLFARSGEWATNREDTEIRHAVLEFCSSAMGIKIEEITSKCIDCHVTRWEEDPFSRGAYSSVAVGASIRHYEALTRPEWDGRLIFAGEATVAEFEGSVHAALYSGSAAAQAVRRCLRISKGG